jgi:predicted GIY-YIG superfamily endonuclease
MEDLLMIKQPAVYILANRRLGTLYIGVTSNLTGRIWQHRQAVVAGFASNYGVKRLVWFELADCMASAIFSREAAEEVEPRMESPADRGTESGMERLMAGRFGRYCSPWIPAFAGMTAEIDGCSPSLE